MLSGLRCSMSTQNGLTSFEVSTGKLSVDTSAHQDYRSDFRLPVNLYTSSSSECRTVPLPSISCMEYRKGRYGWPGQVNMPVTHPHGKSTHLLMTSRVNSLLAILCVDLSAGSPHSQLPGCSTG